MRLGERRKFKTSSHLYSRIVTVNFFRLCWIVLVIWGELGVYFWSLSTCKWPEFKGSSDKPTRILLISDPQVRPLSALHTETFWLGSLRRFIFDLNLKKSWHVTSRIRPHVIIFLGDMLANGKSFNNETGYQQYVQKFKTIFTFEPSVPVHYIPGNNDVGMGISPSQTVRKHYEKVFGSFNQQLVIRNHTFIFLDSPGLVDEDYQRSAHGVGFDRWTAIPGGTVSFVKTVTKSEQPLILFSHIPLSRPDTANCGPLREKGTIRQGVGHGYQNTLGKQTTAFLLKSLQPSAVYSGDNRDYCEYTHVAKEGNATDVREVTIKSFSMANHIRKPGFQLLSVVNPGISSHKSFIDTPCLLPGQNGIYNSYTLFFVFNMITLLVFSLCRSRKGQTPRIEPITISPHSSGRNTPLLDPESAIWSPYTPAIPTSPRGTLPPYLRTPNSLAGPVFRASKPTTPLDSPFLTSFPSEEDESMYPPQYAMRRDGRAQDDDNWSPGHDRISSDPQMPQFTSAPRFKPIVNNTMWSWTFVFRGRRRRMTIKTPNVSLARNSITTLGTIISGKRDRTTIGTRRILHPVIVDMFLILWPAVVVWILFAWWMS